MTTPNHRHGNPLLPPDWQDDWPPSLPRPLPPPEPPAGEPADDVAQGTGYEDGNPPPTPTPILTPAPTTPNGNADGESQTIIEGGGEEGDTPDADGAAGDDVAQVIADVAQGIAYEQDGRPDAPTEPGDGDAFTQPPPPAGDCRPGNRAWGEHRADRRAVHPIGAGNCPNPAPGVHILAAPDAPSGRRAR